MGGLTREAIEGQVLKRLVQMAAIRQGRAPAGVGNARYASGVYAEIGLARPEPQKSRKQAGIVAVGLRRPAHGRTLSAQGGARYL
jgi:hypothetical protein